MHNSVTDGRGPLGKVYERLRKRSYRRWGKNRLHRMYVQGVKDALIEAQALVREALIEAQATQALVREALIGAQAAQALMREANGES